MHINMVIVLLEYIDLLAKENISIKSVIHLEKGFHGNQ